MALESQSGKSRRLRRPACAMDQAYTKLSYILLER